MSIHLVTGFAGKEHITSADQGSFNAGILGTGKYVMNTGNKLAAEIVSNNLVKIKDGDLVNQGRHIRIASDDYEECTIQNGTQARYRNDLIVARYSKNSDTGIESISMVVIKGTASTSSTPPDPSYTSGDILNGALTDDFPLYRVKLNGLSITAVEPLFGDPVKSLSELNTDINDIFGGRTAEIRYINSVQADSTGYKQATLTFNKKFSANPYIFVTVVAPTKATAQAIVESISTESCTFRVYAETSVSVMLQILAIGSVQ